MSALNKEQINSTNVKSHVGQAANELINESKKLAQELYEEGLNKLNTTEEHVKNYSNHMVTKVQENPLASVLIAAGVGFILSKLIKK